MITLDHHWINTLAAAVISSQQCSQADLLTSGPLFPSFSAGKSWAPCSAVRRCVWCSSSFSPAQPTIVSVSWESWDWLSSEMWVPSSMVLDLVRMFFMCYRFLCFIWVMCEAFFSLYNWIICSLFTVKSKCECLSKEVCWWSQAMWRAWKNF